MKAEAPLREAKVQLRMRADDKDLISRAAELKHTTLSAFMIEHAFEAAQQILADQVHFCLPQDKWDEFIAALDAPPRELPRLRKLLSEPSVFDQPR